MGDVSKIRVIELFAGVGGFRLGLEGHPLKKWKMPKSNVFETVWANQWEPPGTAGRQFAFECYRQRFDSQNEHPEKICNEDISGVLDKAKKDEYEIPDCDMIVGGFPCQDYSVARTLSRAGGIEGKKGVLWWQILRLVEMKNPRYLLLENVDRLLGSPASQRGRDFAIMLSCLYRLGYSVEWRVINAAEYGFVQRRRRVYIFAEKTNKKWDLSERLTSTGVIVSAFPIKEELSKELNFFIGKDTLSVSEQFGIGRKISDFQNAGVMQEGEVFTAKTHPDYCGSYRTLRKVLVPESKVPESYLVPEDKLKDWEYCKGSKKIPRIDKKTGHKYNYSEGSMAFPDSLDKPARTILTGEGGATPSRFKHIIQIKDDCFRRLVPDELDQIQGFPKGWTDTGMTDGNRAFCMGNALVVGIPRLLGKSIVDDLKRRNSDKQAK